MKLDEMQEEGSAQTQHGRGPGDEPAPTVEISVELRCARVFGTGSFDVVFDWARVPLGVPGI